MVLRGSAVTLEHIPSGITFLVCWISHNSGGTTISRQQIGVSGFMTKIGSSKLIYQIPVHLCASWTKKEMFYCVISPHCSNNIVILQSMSLTTIKLDSVNCTQFIVRSYSTPLQLIMSVVRIARIG